MVTISADNTLVFTKYCKDYMIYTVYLTLVRTKEDSETVTQCVLVEEEQEMDVVKTLTMKVK